MIKSKDSIPDKIQQLKQDYFIQINGACELEEKPYFLDIDESGHLYCSTLADNKTHMIVMNQQLKPDKAFVIDDVYALTYCVYPNGILFLKKDSISLYDRDGKPIRKLIDVSDFYYSEINYSDDLNAFLYIKSDKKRLELLTLNGKVSVFFDYSDFDEDFIRFTISGRFMYLIGSKSRAVTVVDINGNLVKQIEISLDYNGWNGVDLDASDNLYLCNYERGEIVKLSTEETVVYVYSIRKSGFKGNSYPGEFYHLKIFKETGSCYVTDKQNKIWKFLLDSDSKGA